MEDRAAAGAPAGRRPPAVGLEDLQRIRQQPQPTLANDVAAAILAQLAAGRLVPGDRLPSERSLVEAFGVGRSTVREGLKALGLLGIVEFRHGGGTYVRSGASQLLPRAVEWGVLLSERSTAELVEARLHVEVAAATLAAERRDADAVERIERALDAMAAAADVDAYVEADVEFHLAVAAASGNRVLESMITSIGSLLRAWVRRVLEGSQTKERSVDEHRPVLAAIAAGDAAAAAEAMRAHLSATGARLEASLGDG